jgi:hypothetical protein
MHDYCRAYRGPLLGLQFTGSPALPSARARRLAATERSRITPDREPYGYRHLTNTAAHYGDGRCRHDTDASAAVRA